MNRHSLRLPVGLAAILSLMATLLVVLATQNAAAETPAERCGRETSAYNDAWKSAWRLANPGGGTPPPPAAPYICRDPSLSPEPRTPAPTPAPGLATTTQAPQPTDDRVGSNAPLNFPDYSGTDIVPLPALPLPPGTVAPPELGVATAPGQPALEAERSITIDDVLATCAPVAIPRGIPRSAMTPKQREAYERIRSTSSKSYTDARRKISDDIDAGVYGDRISPDYWDADHVVALSRLVQVPGFTDLAPSDQLAIAHSPENLRPLDRGWNRSKSNLPAEDWDGPRTGRSTPPTEAERTELCTDETEATAYILDQIVLRSSPPERQDAPPSDVTDAPTAAPTLTDTPTRTAEELPYEQNAPPASPQWTPPQTNTYVEPTPEWTQPSSVVPIPSSAATPAPSTSRPPVELPKVTSRPSKPPSPTPRPSTVTEDEDDDSTWEKVKPYAIGAGIITVGVLLAPTLPAIGAATVIGGLGAAATG